MPDGDSRVTLAVVQNDVRHLTDKVQAWRDESSVERKELFVSIKDHERRLVKLERVQWLLGGLAALVSPIAVWALIEIIKTIAALV